MPPKIFGWMSTRPQANISFAQQGLVGGRMAVDLWRNLYTVNYQRLAGAPRTEPSLSEYIPHTPKPGS